ncbi:LacI family DNA-binding transcriptional regulator [Phytoactinopolyspora halotolerans]|uniref:LacI family transcriptional regulator n=1 Tax=Phytoactinopolyspora halotolerans TaxID=1981512 RepID=A0A6L9SAW7_9ACTN|nr:LacI family DNA-binding transcriptional regulator [Phytoactinopolyspora halotolerans]NEE02193.1 LacI family transcriptional regulator [Phytoactinopolyspora halotolerans]
MTSNRRDRDGQRPTLDKVAAHAGVGRGTVSRVINGSAHVSPKAREAVERAIAELGYVPNLAARSLVTRRTDAVALVVSESEARVFGEPFFAGIVRGISSTLVDTQLQLWLAMAQSAAERERVEHHLTPQHVDGVMLLSLHDDDPLPALVGRRGLPLVLGGRPTHLLRQHTASDADARDWFVDVDNAGGAQQAVQHLLASGRRTIATITGPQDMGAGAARLAGYREAHRAQGLPVDEALIEHGDFSYDSGVAAMRQLLSRRPDLDAVFAAADLMAAGALRTLRESGRRVPDDVAVVGFDDSGVARQTDPTLTTVRQPIEEMGREMAHLLVTRISGAPAERTALVLDTSLVIRESA